MRFESYINNLRDLIDKSLDKYLPGERERPASIHRAMRYSVFSGGKKLRPILAIESCHVCGGDYKDILPAAAAIELVHTYSLIHDDLPAMDDHDYRRRKLTSHKVFGEANAILAGDALLTLAFNLIAKKSRPETGLEVIKELSEATGTKGMVGGQVVDLEGRKNGKKTLEYINRLKTARLFEASTKIGAIIAGASPGKIKAMARFGADLGMVFQIMDDILDGEGYVEIYGMGKSRREVKKLINKAKGALRVFGNKAYRLKRIADYISTIA